MNEKTAEIQEKKTNIKHHKKPEKQLIRLQHSLTPWSKHVMKQRLTSLSYSNKTKW